jgi:hypothetical protein
VSGCEKRVEVDGWVVEVRDEEPVIEDTVLAAHLEVDRRHLRELIRQHRDSSNIKPIPNMSAAPTKSRGRPGEGFLLTEPDALFIVTRSSAPKAVALTKEMIRVFIAVRRTLLAPPPPAPARALAPPRATVRIAPRSVPGSGLTFVRIPEGAPPVPGEMRAFADLLPPPRFDELSAWPALRARVASLVGGSSASALDTIAAWPVPASMPVSVALVRDLAIALAMHERAG